MGAQICDVVLWTGLQVIPYNFCLTRIPDSEIRLLRFRFQVSDRSIIEDVVVLYSAQYHLHSSRIQQFFRATQKSPDGHGTHAHIKRMV